MPRNPIDGVIKSLNEAAQLRRTMSQNFDADKLLGLNVGVEVYCLF